MHDRAAVENKIGEIFERKLNLKVPSPSADLFDSGALDSLSFVELLLQIETEFGLRISLLDVEVADFRTVARIAAFIRRLRSQNAHGNEIQFFYADAQCQA